MVKIKYLILITIILTLSGCKSNSYDKNNGFTFDGYMVDEETCVEYFIVGSGYGSSISVRFDKNSKVILDEECLLKKGE